MILYIAKHPEIYPRYQDWTTIGSLEWFTEDFTLFNVKIEGIVYIEDSKKFREHYNKIRMWERLING